MKLRDINNIDICNSNELPYVMLTNVVEEKNTKGKMRAVSNMIAKALIATLGPYGSSTIIQDREGRHFATKDGYDLMNRMSFDDDVARTILDLFRTTASNQVLSVGDGSTSAIIVANALFQSLTDPNQIEQFKKIAPKDIVDILSDISELVESELKKMAKPVSEDMRELDIIAAIANNNDVEAGKLIADIYRKIGQHGFISMDVLSNQAKDSYEIKSGIEWQRGYVDPLFAMNYKDGRIIYDANPRVIICNSCLTYEDLELGLIPLLKEAHNQENAEVLIIANDYEEDVLTFLKANRTKHLKLGDRSVPMNFTAVDIDLVTKESRNTLEDLALLCNCRIYDKFNTKPAEVIANPSQFIGHAEKVIITAKSTQVISKSDQPNKKRIDALVKEFHREIDNLLKIEVPTKEEDMKLYELRRRLSRLTGSSAILHVGGKTRAERMTRERLIEDAVFACKSALQYGYIPGGNISIPKVLLLNKEPFCMLLGEKYKYLPIENIRSFFAYFIDLLVETFLESYRAVLNNSYMDEETTENVIDKCLEENLFYNLKLHKYEDYDDTLVINSVNTDIQILRSCMSLVAILSTSNQFMTINLDVTGQIKKDK